jgi:hypothetical protein
LLALGTLICKAYRKKRQQANSRDAPVTPTPTTTISTTAVRAFILPSKSSDQLLLHATIFPYAETVHLTSVRMRFLRAPIAHRSVGQWPPNRPRARRKQCSISDVDDNRTALIAPSTARFTDLGMSVSLPNFIQ